MNSIENNILIGEFKGWRYNPHDGKLSSFSLPNNKMLFLDGCKFHEDYRFIMEVVEQIEALGFVFRMRGNLTTFLRPKGSKFVKIWNDEFKGKNKVEAIYNAVVEFIKWHNENK